MSRPGACVRRRAGDETSNQLDSRGCPIGAGAGGVGAGERVVFGLPVEVPHSSVQRRRFATKGDVDFRSR